MKQDYSKYTDDMLIAMWEEALDLDENIFFVLNELSNRKHPNTKQYCYDILNEFDGVPYFESSALDTLYSIDEEAAIDYAIENYKRFHSHTLGSIASLLWVDSEQEKTNKKIELIKLIKKQLKTLNKSEIEEFQDGYDEFMKAYKNL